MRISITYIITLLLLIGLAENIRPSHWSAERHHETDENCRLSCPSRHGREATESEKGFGALIKVPADEAVSNRFVCLIDNELKVHCYLRIEAEAKPPSAKTKK